MAFLPYSPGEKSHTNTLLLEPLNPKPTTLLLSFLNGSWSLNVFPLSETASDSRLGAQRCRVTPEKGLGFRVGVITMKIGMRLVRTTTPS